MPAARTSWGLGLYGAGDLTQAQLWAGLPLVIEETTGPRRRLELSGRALPTSPFEVTLDRQGRTILYPGQAAATQHVTTYSEGSTRLNGKWESLWLQESDIAVVSAAGLGAQAVRSVADLRQYVETLVKGGQRIRVEWAGIERFSSVMRFGATFQTANLCNWEWSFDWAGAGQFKALPVEDAIDAGARGIFDTVGDLLDLAATPALMAADLADFARDGIARIEGLSRELREVLQLYATTPANFADVAARALGLTTSISSQAKALREAVAPRSASSSIATGDGGAGAAEAAALMAIDAWLRDTGRAAVRTRAAAETQKGLLLQARDPSVRKTVFVQGDTDLRFIAQREYGDASLWQTIADANGLAGSLVPGGYALIIPERSRGAA